MFFNCFNERCQFKIVLLSALVVFNAAALSAFYFDAPHEMTQPDGSVITVILNGDEYYMHAETPDGFTVVRDRQTGWICYAELSEDKSELVSTGVPVGYEIETSISLEKKEKKITANKTIQKKLKITKEARLKKIKQKQKQLFGEDFEVINGLAYPANTTETTAYDQQPIDTFQAVQAAPGTLPPTKNTSNFSATIKGLVLVFDFSDAPASYTLQQYQDKVNKVNSHYANGNAASLRTFYEDVSRGVFIMDHFVYGIYRAPQTFAYYDSLPYTEGAHQLMDYALNDMENNGFDFSQLTTFASGEIRALAVMYTGSPADWAEGMWYHAGGWGGFSADGVHTGRYCTDTANDLNPGTLIHEHGHMAAEWPDTYSYISGEPGTWGVMGGGYCDLPNPYFLYENGWLDGENIMDAPGLKTMNSSDPTFAYFYYDPDQPTEFYMMRPYVNSLLYCPDIPDQGMTFWRINTQGDNANYPDTDRHIELVHANNDDYNKTSNVCFKEGGLLDQFTPYTIPSTDWKFSVKAGEQSGMDITDISTPGAEMTFTLGTPSTPVPYYPLNGSMNDASGSGYSAIGYNFSGSQWSNDVFDGSYFDFSQSLQFDGIDDYVVSPSAISATDELTIAFWIRPEVLNDMIPLDKFPADSSGAGWSIHFTQDGHIEFLIGSQSNNTSVMTPHPVYEANRWTHVACTYGNGTARIFVNGEIRMIKKGIPQTTNTTALNLQMGIAPQVNTSWIYQGLLDDVRFYDIALESGPLNAIEGLNFKPENSILALLKLDETRGTLAKDSSGHNTDGTLNNGLSFNTDSISGPVGNALSFDGVDDYVSLPSISKYNNGFTVTLWAYPTAVKGWSRFIDFGNGEWSENVLLSRYQSSNDLVFESYSTSGSGGYVIASGAIELNKWQFFAATIDSSGNVKIYKNGQVIQTGTSAVLPNVFRRNLYIGRSNWSADSYYQGAMDEVRVYNYPLSEGEIHNVYRNNRMDGPVPFDGDDDVSPEVTLNFSPAGNALRHDIYFGTKYNAVQNADMQSPEYVGRKQYTEYNPASLDAWNEYFWRVDELMPDGSIQTGPVWRFSTSGSIQRQVWTGLSGANEVTALTGSADYPDHPSLVTDLETFEIPTNWDESYGTRVHGLLVPQTSGNYQFWISGDNEVELWLSSDADPVNGSLIAYIHGTWSSPLNFDQHSSQQSSLIYLQAGHPYYIMALHKEGDGGDHMAVAWQGPDSPIREIIDDFWLRPPAGNEWPRFDSEVASSLDAIEGIPFSSTLSSTASDPDLDNVYYKKQTGPNWLRVLADGQLLGIPENGDVNTNSFTIRAYDDKGGYDDIILPIHVENRLTGTMGLEDLFGFASEWLSTDPSSEANLDQIEPVNFNDFSLLSNQWDKGLVEGLVAYWTLDDTTGLIARDNYDRQHGILTNMTEYNWVDGVLNNALAFDGMDDYVEIPDYKGVTGTDSRTCTFWIQTNEDRIDIMGWGRLFDDNQQALIGQKWQIVYYTGEIGALVQGGNAFCAGPEINDGLWHHVAVVLEDANHDGILNIDETRFYIDGLTRAISRTVPLSIDTAAYNDVHFGIYPEGSSYLFNGALDDVRIYDRALTEADIQAIAVP